MSLWEALAFSSRQKKGILVFLFLLICLIGIRWGITPFFQYYLSRRNVYIPVPQSFTPFDSIANKTIQYTGNKLMEESHVNDPDSSYRLEINLADTSEWRKLKGIGRILSQRIVRYRYRLGGFRSINQLQQVYGLSRETFSRIQPYLRIDSTAYQSSIESDNHLEFSEMENRNQIYDTVKKYNNNLSLGNSDSNRSELGTIVELNTSDTLMWESLPGIGQILSHRIVKFRLYKKGFQKISDLKEVYGLTEEVYNRISPHIYVDSSYLSKLDSLFPSHIKSDSYSKKIEEDSVSIPLDLVKHELNSIDSLTLISLAGINPQIAHRIVTYRKMIGFYSQVDQLQHIYGLSRKRFNEIEKFFYVDSLSSHLQYDLNMITQKKLSYYPFIDEDLSKRIIDIRNSLGRFANWEEVLHIEAIDSSKLRLFKIYFKL